MKKTLTLSLLLCAFLMPNQLFALGQKLVTGAGTLPSGDLAFTTDVGLAIPSPLLYGLRLDIGLGNRFQLGIEGTILGIINSGTVYSTFNVYKTSNDSDFISLYLNPSVINLMGSAFDEDSGQSASITIFNLEPGVAYEHRFGIERSLGLYLKAGATFVLASSSAGKTIMVPMDKNTALVNFLPGIQKNFGSRFSMNLDVPMFIALNHTKDVKWNMGRLSIGGKLGLSWIW